MPRSMWRNRMGSALRPDVGRDSASLCAPPPLPWPGSDDRLVDPVQSRVIPPRIPCGLGDGRRHLLRRPWPKRATPQNRVADCVRRVPRKESDRVRTTRCTARDDLVVDQSRSSRRTPTRHHSSSALNLPVADTGVPSTPRGRRPVSRAGAGDREPSATSGSTMLPPELFRRDCPASG